MRPRDGRGSVQLGQKELVHQRALRARIQQNERRGVFEITDGGIRRGVSASMMGAPNEKNRRREKSQSRQLDSHTD